MGSTGSASVVSRVSSDSVVSDASTGAGRVDNASIETIRRTVAARAKVVRLMKMFSAVLRLS
jgi:hypothetical protein